MKKKDKMCSLNSYESDVVVEMVKIEELNDFKDHPFKVERNQELFELMQSIISEGVMVPLIVRKNPYGKGYEIISGHRRTEAAKWAGITELPAIIKNLDDAQATLIMVDSNLHREKILPSEKAYAYKMRLEAMKLEMKHAGSEADPLGPNEKFVNVSKLNAKIDTDGSLEITSSKGKRSNEQLSKMVGESVTQIKRYIRLTNLVPKILDMVDRGEIALRSAVEISYLKEEEQYELYAVMDLEQSIPNISQANRLKRMSQQGKLDMEMICSILCEPKANQKEQVKIPLSRIGKYFPKEYTPLQQVNLIEKLLKEWSEQKPKLEPEPSRKSAGSKTEYIKTEYNNNQSNHIISTENSSEHVDKYTVKEYEDLVKENIDYNTLMFDYKYDKDLIQGLYELILEVLLTEEKKIKVAGGLKNSELVKDRFMKLRMNHIQYVVECLKKNTTKVNNVKSYMLTALFNAPATINEYYNAKVNNEMYGETA